VGSTGKKSKFSALLSSKGPEGQKSCLIAGGAVKTGGRGKSGAEDSTRKKWGWREKRRQKTSKVLLRLTRSAKLVDQRGGDTYLSEME